MLLSETPIRRSKPNSSQKLRASVLRQPPRSSTLNFAKENAETDRLALLTAEGIHKYDDTNSESAKEIREEVITNDLKICKKCCRIRNDQVK
ncbi:hypothetical protein BRADI_1g56743v3 [Brachypodium distachyon]|uniref:Uncharacterized protein n=1 Tax=Brachypodium distachyon TaxID=15368 RepID=A0A0Q3HD87_BRADI|nr:hypothetical protein BRADI_1g56743v3 [Brachypodium distachyon]